MSQCGGCNATPILFTQFNNFQAKLKYSLPAPKVPIQTQNITPVHPFTVNSTKTPLPNTSSMSSQFTNNGKFLKYTRN